MTLQELSRFYGVPLLDYERTTHGMLVGSGAGTMMAVMDAVPSFRWCFDVDAMKDYLLIGDYLAMVARFCPEVKHFGVVGWFSITDPEPLRFAVARTSLPCWTYAGDRLLGAGIPCVTLADFIDATKGLS